MRLRSQKRHWLPGFGYGDCVPRHMGILGGHGYYWEYRPECEIYLEAGENRSSQNWIREVCYRTEAHVFACEAVAL